jgi:hypothetical protein
MQPQAGADPGQLHTCGKICVGKEKLAACAASGALIKNTKNTNDGIIKRKSRFFIAEALLHQGRN